MDTSSKIYIAGHRGLVGSAVMRRLESLGFTNLLTRTHNELDLTDQMKVKRFFREEKPEYVVLAAAKVGGIHANNTYPADFIYKNLMIEANIVNATYQYGIERLLFLGSSCIYPRAAEQPMREEALLTGPLEPTNEPYALAKIVGIKLCESYNQQHGTDFRSVMPTNLYGPGDNFHQENAHVIPTLMRRFHNAKRNCDDEAVVWGSGKPMREFMHVNDMASASVFVLGLDKSIYDANTQPTLSHINIGTGVDCTIREMAETMKRVVGFEGTLTFDTSKPDGAPRKLMDLSRITDMGWRYSIDLEEGLISTYKWAVSTGILDHG